MKQSKFPSPHLFYKVINSDIDSEQKKFAKFIS